MLSTRTNTRLFICAVVVDGKTVDVFAANSLEFVNRMAREAWADQLATYKFTRSTRA